MRTSADNNHANVVSGMARFLVDRNYGEIMVATADEKRMERLEQVMANDGHLARLAKEAREAAGGGPSRG